VDVRLKLIVTGFFLVGCTGVALSYCVKARMSQMLTLDRKEVARMSKGSGVFFGSFLSFLNSGDSIIIEHHNGSIV
jgi:hypothetical protein